MVSCAMCPASASGKGQVSRHCQLEPWVLWVIAGWGLNIVLSLVWYLFDCDDECNYRNH